MAKKIKGNTSGHRHQANAPQYQQIFQNAEQRQPPHNPYYPDPSVGLLTPTSVPPPPYSSSTTISSSAARNTVPMSYMNDISYPRLQPGASSVVIQASGVPYDHRADRYRRKVRSFNSQTIILAVLSILLAVWAYNLYNQRNCIPGFVVHKVNKDVEIKISDVRDAHLNVAFAGALVIIICLLKSAIGFGGKSHSCFLFIIGLISLFVCIHNAYLVYLTYYSPCVASIGELTANAGKTFISKFVDSLPTPDKGLFGESNVIEKAREDSLGLVIFLVDSVNAVFYFSIFLSSLLMC